MTLEGWYFSIAFGLETLFLHRYLELRALRANMIVFERGHFFVRNPVEYAIEFNLSIKIQYFQRERKYGR